MLNRVIFVDTGHHCISAAPEIALQLLQVTRLFRTKAVVGLTMSPFHTVTHNYCHVKQGLLQKRLDSVKIDEKGLM